MSTRIPKPDLHRLVAAIREHTQLAIEIMDPVTGAVTFDVEQVLRRIIVSAMESGIELQREAILADPDFMATPLLPPPSNIPDVVVALPRPPKLPKGC